MAITINASTSSGLVQSADNSGIITLQNNGTNALTVNAGNLQFNSGYGSVATGYGCRAWVNFNGTGTVAIRASGNVSSITDVSTGRYDVNFTTAMPDANYSPVVFLNGDAGTGAGAFAAAGGFGANTLATGSVRVEYYNGGFVDSALVFVAIFR